MHPIQVELNRAGADGEFAGMKRSDGFADERSTAAMEKLTTMFAAWRGLGRGARPANEEHSWMNCLLAD